jgi:two-component system, chemotaxis family, chemotaxis protein CheY
MAYNFLIVDDSSIVRRVIIKAMRMTDVQISQVLEAEDGLQALETLKNNWVDLVFLDINMPRMNGIEFMEHIRADEALKDTPVVVVSTEGSRERIEKLESLDIKAYLRKPVTPESFTEVVTRVLGEIEDGKHI